MMTKIPWVKRKEAGEASERCHFLFSPWCTSSLRILATITSPAVHYQPREAHPFSRTTPTADFGEGAPEVSGFQSVGTKRKSNSPASTKKTPPSKRAKPTTPNDSSSDEDSSPSSSPSKETNKRQQKLLKNREAAQLFRKRQKNYIQDLEQKVNTLGNENQQFTCKIELLQSENRLLRDQLSYLRSFLTHVMSMAAANAQKPMDPSGVPQVISPTQTPSPFSFPCSSSPPMAPHGDRCYPAPMPNAPRNVPGFQTNPASVAAAFQAAMGVAPRVNTSPDRFAYGNNPVDEHQQ